MSSQWYAARPAMSTHEDFATLSFNLLATSQVKSCVTAH